MEIIRGRLILPDIEIEDGEIGIDHGRIVHLGLTPQHSPATYHFKDFLVAPGLIDLHHHGCVGYDFMDADQMAIKEILKANSQRGVTSVLATTMTGPHSQLKKAVAAIAEAWRWGAGHPAQLVGINLEGPYINRAKCGAQDPAFIRVPLIEEIDELFAVDPGLIRVVTVAPEIEGAEPLIRYVVTRGGVVSLGHSNATWEQGILGIHWGGRLATHLFNGMSSVHHRDPGLPGALMLDPRVMLELICDGVHVHPAMVRFLLRQTGSSRVVLITDSIRATGMEDGEYELGGRPINVLGGVARGSDGGLAGSTTDLLGMVCNMRRFGELSWSEALHMASLNPARVLGMEREMGSLELGKRANVIVFSEDGTNRMTMVNGRVTFMADR